jgi:molybdate-binding protein/transcriptional regulator with XRE-family HTH domain
MSVLGNCVARKRAAAGLRQQELAVRVGLSRQSLSALEAGHSTPSGAVVLRLAQALGCNVEELFWIDDGRAAVRAELAAVDGAEARQPAAGTRVALASIAGRWVAHPLGAGALASFLAAADGVLSGRGRARDGEARVTLLDDAAAARSTLVCAGCAPAFGILAARASRGAGTERVLWLERSSAAALELLARGQVHIAGAHLYDEEAREFNVPFVRRRLPGQPMLVYNLARWEAGLVVAAGNPRRIRGARDLSRPDVSLLRRQPGSAAEDLLARLLRREGAAPRRPGARAVIASGHMEVGRLVALGVADTGIALPAVARAHGLDFVPLAEERFDLVVARELSGDARVVRLLDTLGSRNFRREMESLGGHAARDAGKLIADTTLHA